MEVPDFTGWASKNDLLCSDGRTIRRDAFAHQDGQKVPLVWQHQHNSPDNVLGYAVLRNKPLGVRTEAFFNDTPAGMNAKKLVMHGDITGLSIFANKLVQKTGDVLHGFIREVSLVFAGANPEAMIDNTSFAHSDGAEMDEEAIIYTGEDIIMHGDDNDEELDDDQDDATDTAGDEQEQEEEVTKDQQLEHADGDEETIQDVYDSMSPKQQEVLHFMVGEALEQSGDAPDIQHGESITPDDLNKAIKEGIEMGRNLFTEQDQGNDTGRRRTASLSHDQLQTIMSDGQKFGSLSESFHSHADEYGIEDIDFLFLD